MCNRTVQLKKQKVVIFEKENVILRIICFCVEFHLFVNFVY